MIKQLIRLANHLDKKGLQKEADYLDAIIRKVGGSYDSQVGGLAFWDLGDELKAYLDHPKHKFAKEGLRFLPYLRTNSKKSFVLALDGNLNLGGNAYWVECCNCRDSKGDPFMIGSIRITEKDIKSKLNTFGTISDNRMKISFEYC